MKLWARIGAAIAFCSVLETGATAATVVQVKCSEFFSTHNDDERLFNGYIYGFVAGRLGYGDAKRLNFEAARVRALTAAFCRKSPNDPVAKVIDLWTTYLARHPEAAR